MLASAKRHAFPHTSQSQQPHKPKYLDHGSHFTQSAPPTPSNAHTAQRPTTATGAPATFSRATGAAAAAAKGGVASRPMTANGSLHLPPSVPMSFPTPVASAATLESQPSPLDLNIPHRPFMSSSPSPLSSGLPSPTLPPFPSSRLPFPSSSSSSQPVQIQVASPPSQARSPVIKMGTPALDSTKEEFGTIGGNKNGAHYQHHHHHPPPPHSARPFGQHHRKYSTNSIMSTVSSISSPHAVDMASTPSSPHSSHSMHEDVLAPGDRVGPGLRLRGEVLQGVDFASHGELQWKKNLDDLLGLSRRDDDDYEEIGHRKKEPAAELEVVRRLGAGSYAVVYLVREVLSQPPPGVLDDLDKDSRDASSDRLGEFEFEYSEQDVWDAGLQFDPSGSDADRNSQSSGKDQDQSVYYGREYAVKVLSKQGMDEDAIDAQRLEANIHQSVPSHSNIVTLYRTLETSSFLLLILEYVPGDDLFFFLEQARDHYEPDPPGDEMSKRHIASKSMTDISISTMSINTLNTARTPPTPSLLSSLNENQLLSKKRLKLIASMFSQMCEAVAVCHDAGVYHRDIKPENFIVTDGWDDDDRRVVVVKLTDFGLSTRDKASSDMDCGSAPYMSFECRNNCAPTYSPRSADVWSLGIVLINMLYHINPWTDTTQGVCPSFSSFLASPELFFMQRFSGMVQEVAAFLAKRVFCLLPNDDPMDEGCRRVSAREFGRWVKELPRLMASRGPVGEPPALAEAEKILEEAQKEELISPTSPTLPLSPTTSLLTQSLLQVLEQREAYGANGTAGPSSPAWRHRRGLSNASIGYSLSSVPQSRRPASRKTSFSITEAAPLSSRIRTMDLTSAGPSSRVQSHAATPLMRGRTISRLGSMGQDSHLSSTVEPMGMELPTVPDEGEGDMSMSSVNDASAAFLGLCLETIQQERKSLEGNDRQGDAQTGDNDHDHDQEQDREQDGEEQESNSRSQSVVRKRKRGARKGKGQIIIQQQQEIARLQAEAEAMKAQIQQLQQTKQPPGLAKESVKPPPRQPPPTVPLPAIPTDHEDYSNSLTLATESLARELSRKSRSTTNHRSSSAAVSPGSSMLSLTSSTNSHARSGVAVHPITTAREGAKAAGIAASALAAASGPTPGALFPVSFASFENKRTRGASPAASKSRNTLSSSSVNVSVDSASASGSSNVSAPVPMSSVSVPVSVAPAPSINKKASKWKLAFGKSSNQSRSTLSQPQDEVIDIGREDVERASTVESTKSNSSQQKRQEPASNPVDDYARILDGLSYTGFIAPSQPSPPSQPSLDTWRGRRPIPKPHASAFGNSVANSSSNGDRWPSGDQRNVSPNSLRTGRTAPSSGSGSVVSLTQSSASSNWRNSTITNSSASSGFTRYSNGSVRSVSTVATSLSGNSGSWRDKSSVSLASGDRRPTGSGAARGSDGSVRVPPPNVKIMTGVPWALNELPRQLQSNDDLYGPSSTRKQRVRKPKEMPTINERPGRGAKSPLSQRLDAARSSSDLNSDTNEARDGVCGVVGAGTGASPTDLRDAAGMHNDVDEGFGAGENEPRKVQKGQINALAKMLQALRR